MIGLDSFVVPHQFSSSAQGLFLVFVFGAWHQSEEVKHQAVNNKRRTTESMCNRVEFGKGGEGGVSGDSQAAGGRAAPCFDVKQQENLLCFHKAGITSGSIQGGFVEDESSSSGGDGSQEEDTLWLLVSVGIGLLSAFLSFVWVESGSESKEQETDSGAWGVWGE